MFKSYLKIAFRNLLRHKKGYGTTNILGLAIAVTAVLLLSLWIQNELRFDNYHPDAERIYLVKNTYQYDNGNSEVTDNSPHEAVYHLQNHFSDIEEVAYAMRPYSLEIMHQGEVYDEQNALFISNSWFDVFHYDFLYGTSKAAFDHTHSLIITESKALQFFGSTDIIGRTLKIDSMEYAVQAVIKDIPSNSSIQYDILLPFKDPTVNGGYSDWTNFTTKIFVRLNMGADPLQATQYVQRLFEKNLHYVQQGVNVKSRLLPLSKIHFDQDLSTAVFQLGNLQHVYIFSGIVALLLIVASINYVTISIAQSLSRSREIGTRKVVGATKWQLFLQMMAESFLFSTISMVIALIFVYLLMPNFNLFFGISLEFNFINTHIILLVCFIWAVLIFFTGVYPAVFLSSLSSIHIFRGNGSLQFGGRNIRKALLLGQFVLAIFIIVLGTTMYRQMKYVQHKDTAYNRSQIFSVQIPPVDVADVLVDPNEDWKRFSMVRGQMESQIRRTIKQEMKDNSNVKNISLITASSVLNEKHKMVGLLEWPGKDPGFQPQYATWTVDVDFAQVMGLNMESGRWFLEGDQTDSGNFIINEAAVSEFGIPEPAIGHPFNFNGKEGLIVGIVKDFHFEDLRNRIKPLILEKQPYFGSNLIVQAQPDATKNALSLAKSTFKKYFPEKAFSYKFIDEEFDKLYRKDQQTLVIVLIFSGISVFLSLLGLLGMLAFDVQQRTKEIGIRKVMGATVFNIANMLSKDFLVLIIIGFAIATPVAWYAGQAWLVDFAYRINMPWWMFGLAGLGTVIIALTTISFQAVKAALANPVNSLKSE